jgi:hypothetical protein
MRRHPLGFQAIFFGVVFPLLSWVVPNITGWSGFPHAVRLLDFIVYWVVLGSVSGMLFYGIQRLIVSVISRPPRR